MGRNRPGRNDFEREHFRARSGRRNFQAGIYFSATGDRSGAGHQSVRRADVHSARAHRAGQSFRHCRSRRHAHRRQGARADSTAKSCRYLAVAQFHDPTDIASATQDPNAAVFITNLQSPVVSKLGDTTVPVAVSSNLTDFWVLAQDIGTGHARLLKFAAGTAAAGPSAGLGLVKAVAVDGTVAAGENDATPGGVEVALVTAPGQGQLVTFHGGNPNDASRLTIVLDGEPHAMSVLELAIGGNPVQFAWVTVATQRRGSRVL